MKSDFLVIGSGSAGLSFALKVADTATVTIVTKGKLNECNTNYAQGGICSVTYAPDTFEKHIEDTLVCGAGKCDHKAVELVVKNAPRLRIVGRTSDVTQCLNRFALSSLENRISE